MFLFTTARGPGALLAPHLLLHALLAAVAKIVLPPSASAPSPLPPASFVSQFLCPRACVGRLGIAVVCSAGPGLIPSVLGCALCDSALFGERAGARSTDGSGQCLISVHDRGGSLGVPKVGGCCSHRSQAGRLCSCLSPNVILHGQTPSLQSWPDCQTS